MAALFGNPIEHMLNLANTVHSLQPVPNPGVPIDVARGFRAPSVIPSPGVPVDVSRGFRAPTSGSMPPNPVTSEDENNASTIAQHLANAISVARDPNLKESLAGALAAIHKHLAGLQKERHDALQGKFSPRLMEAVHNAAQGAQGAAGNAVENAYQGIMPQVGSPVAAVANAAQGLQQPFPNLPTGPQAPMAHFLAEQGRYQDAVNTWAAHHPYAMAHNQIPSYVRQWEAAYSHAPSVAATAQ